MKSFMGFFREDKSTDVLTSLTYRITKKKALSYTFVSSEKKLRPMSYTVATEETIVITKLPDGVETKNTAKTGDVIISGVSGEQYVIRAAKMADLYIGNIGSKITVKSNPRKVAQYNAPETITFKAPWGEDMILKSGDYVVKDGDGYYRIAKAEFEKTYQKFSNNITQ